MLDRLGNCVFRIEGWLLLVCVMWAVMYSEVSAQEALTDNGVVFQRQGTFLDAKAVEEFTDDAIERLREAYNIPGVVVAITEGEKTLLTKGYGFADLENQVDVDAREHAFRIASVSKLFTWASVMQLVEQGELDLHTDINQYLDFEIPRTFEQPITLWHLLTHTPGFEDTNIGGSSKSLGDLTGLGPALKASIPDRVVKPGVRTGYSNYGTSLAGYIVELKSGKPFADYVDEHIFSPLGMTASSFQQPLPDHIQSKLVQGYTFDGEAHTAGPYEFMKRYPDGGVVTTAPDMAAFAKAHLVGAINDIEILSPTTRVQMHRRQFANLPQAAGMTLGFIEAKFNGHRVIAHGGDINYFTSKLFLLPEHQISVFVSFNSDSIGPSRALFMQWFMDRFFPSQDDNAPPLFSDAPLQNASDDIEGQYVSSRRNYSTIEKLIWPLMTGVSIARVDEETISVSFAGETYQYQRISRGIYQPVEDEIAGADFGAVIATLDSVTGEKRLYFSRFASFYFEETPLHENLTVNAGWLAISLLLLVSGLASALFFVIRKQLRLNMQEHSKRTLWLVLSSGMLAIASLFLILTSLTPELIYGVTLTQRLYFALPLALVPLCGFLFWYGWAPTRRAGAVSLLLSVRLTAIGLFMLLLQMDLWNFLGFNNVPNL